jgi:hypothetical protein
VSRLVWYAAYGSNLSRARFGFYLRGGTPEGASHVYPGSRDASDPLDDRPWEIQRELVFGGTSRTWGGGVASVDPDSQTSSKARLYLITADQFGDVVAQENWLPPGSVNATVAGDETVIGVEHMYGLVLALGSVDDHPVLTFTQHRGLSRSRPSPAYLHHIAEGLREAHGMTSADIVDYLAKRPGILGNVTADELRTIIERSHA